MEIFSTVLWHLRSNLSLSLSHFFFVCMCVRAYSELRKEVELSYLAHELVDVDRLSAAAWCAVGNCFSLQKEHDTALQFFQRVLRRCLYLSYSFPLKTRRRSS